MAKTCLLFLGILLLYGTTFTVQNDKTCDRRPSDADTDPLPPDNKYVLEVDNLRESLYIPGQTSKVRLYARDNTTSFIAFTISLKGDTDFNKDNPRKPLLLSAGTLEPYPDSNNVIKHPYCNNTVMQMDKTRKTSVEALWTAPKKNQKCVMIFAVLAVEDNVWYSYDGPLSKTICEDRRKTEDMLPVENTNCQVCENAKYQVIFQGLWTYNTHPKMYPTTQDLAKFSDLVGASHSKHKTVFELYTEASNGLKMLAEQGNTTTMELEIRKDLAKSVRTVIKATAPPAPDEETVISFRVTREHHLVSLVTGLLPSPDWFLGVANMELCEAQTNKWAENIRYNLYPLDAGTDSGKTFEASNEVTSPPQPIRPATIDKMQVSSTTKPFARLVVQLVRTYYNPNCTSDPTATEIGYRFVGEQTGGGVTEEVVSEKDEPSTPATTTTTTEEPVSVDPESECPMTSWSDWQECQGDCIDNKVEGFQLHLRSHHGDPSPECAEKMSLSESRGCSEVCEEETNETNDYGEEP